MNEKHLIFIMCYVVFVLFVIVHFSKCNPTKPRKKSKAADPEQGSKSLPVGQPEVNATNATFFDFNDFKKLPAMPFITYRPYIFEGVDYDTIPEDIMTPYNDCYGHYTRCIRDRVYFHRVCAYNKYSGWVTFNTQCQLELRNCIYRTTVSNTTLYGNDVKNDREFYQGDGYLCVHSLAARKANPDGMHFDYEDQKLEDYEDYVYE